MSQIPQSRPYFRPKLYIWETVSQTYRSVFTENLRFLPKAALAPSLLIIALSFLLQAFGLHIDPTVHQESEEIGLDSAVAELPVLLANLILYFPAVMFAVPWIRLVLLGPETAPPPLPPQWSSMHWRVLGYGIVAALGGLATLIAGSLVFSLISIGAVALGAPTAIRLLATFVLFAGFIAVFIYAAAIYVRLMLAIPALLAGQVRPLRVAWQRSRRHNIALFLVLLLITLPLLIVGFVPFVLSNGGLAALTGGSPYPVFYDPAGPYFPLLVLWNTALWIVGIAIHGAFVAIVYRSLIEGYSGEPSTDAHFDSPR